MSGLLSLLFQPRALITNTMKSFAHSLILLAFACAAFGAATDISRQADERNVQEAAITYLLTHNSAGLEKRAKAYYLGIGLKTADPSDEFLKRFTNQKPPVKKRSAASVNPDKGVLDKQTGERGAILRLYDVKWISESEAELEAGFYEIGNRGYKSTYTVKKENGKWKVTKATSLRKE